MKIRETFCQPHRREIPTDPLPTGPGLVFSGLQAQLLSWGLPTLSSRAPVTARHSRIHLCQKLASPGTSGATSHQSAAPSHWAGLKMPYSTLTFKWSFGWRILGWKLFLFRILKTWLHFVCFWVAAELSGIVMVLCMKHVFPLQHLIFSLYSVFRNFTVTCLDMSLCSSIIQGTLWTLLI